MRLYHGSNKIIKNPQYGYGKTYNDYGQGFYCTENKDLAKEWAVSLEKDGYANVYELDTTDLDILNLNDEKYCVLHWLAILLDNREFEANSPLGFEAKKYIRGNFLLQYQNKDIITGYRADDSYFSFAQDFINGGISYRQLCNAMHLGKLGEQIVLKSKAAFEQIKFVEYESALSSEWFLRKEKRDKEARREYFDVEKNKRQKGDIYITDILDEEMNSDDERLRQNIFR